MERKTTPAFMHRKKKMNNLHIKQMSHPSRQTQKLLWRSRTSKFPLFLLLWYLFLYYFFLNIILKHVYITYPENTPHCQSQYQPYCNHLKFQFRFLEFPTVRYINLLTCAKLNTVTNIVKESATPFCVKKFSNKDSWTGAKENIFL